MLITSIATVRRERQHSLLELALKLRANDSMSAALLQALDLVQFSIELSRFLHGHWS